MKILLMTHPITVYNQDPTIPDVAPPLGLAYIASYLESNGYEVRILDVLSLGMITP